MSPRVAANTQQQAKSSIPESESLSKTVSEDEDDLGDWVMLEADNDWEKL